MKVIDLGTLESDLQRALDEIYSLLERVKIRNSIFKRELIIEISLDSLAYVLQEIDKENKDNPQAELIITKTIYLLQIWFKIAYESGMCHELEIALVNNLRKVHDLCLEYQTNKNDSIINLIDDFQTNIDELKKLSSNNTIEFNQVIRLFITDSITSNLDNNILHKNIEYLYNGIGSLKSYLVKEILQENEWEVDIYIKDSDVSNEFLLMSTLTKILSLDNKNVISIGSLKIGSLITRLKTKFTNIWNKKETKEIVNMTRDELIAYATKQSVENDKTKAESEKLQVETEQLKREMASQTQEELLQLKSLELRKLNAEVLGQELDNELKKVEIFEKYSQLLTSNILQVDEFELKIDGKTIIKKIGNNISGKQLE